ETITRALLEEQGLGEGYVGWTMVVLAGAFWRDQVAAVPPSRRLFLLPHCLKHAEGCPADYDDFGLECKKCGACSIADFRTAAEEMGYKVLVAEGSPIVLKIIVSGHIDGILGVACLNVLEKAIDKVLLAGVPSYAIPLHSGDCKNTKLDESWVWEVMDRYEPVSAVRTSSYMPLMRAAHDMFEEDFEHLVPRVRTNGKADSFAPLGGTERIAFDFLANGGKRFRPFVTLAAYDARVRPADEANVAGDEPTELADPIRRTAMAIEAFHKASLVHDDIEDDDEFRYGEPTLHSKYGVATAINVGDYLIGLGYRLVSRESSALGPDVAADILDRLAGAHMKLTEGQGAELMWRDSLDKRLKPIDALKIYALKTAPAFEAAAYCGVRLAGPADEYIEPISRFARNLGVAFQMLNDLKDWQGDDNNKLGAAGDVLGGRPTVLWALALEGLDAAGTAELEALVSDDQLDKAGIARVRELYEQANVFEKVERLVDKYQQRAEEVADEIQPDELRRLFYYLVDTVLERPTQQEGKPAVEVIQPTIPADLTAIVSKS
ncbi:MAG: polyprenyl synthetase family protein, partial [Planctomycetes bacterium]|nr:polyprenyl synthetase family protein [Planctomycetota bacterium]